MRVDKKIKNILGYSKNALNESHEEDILDCYRDLVCAAKSECSLEDIVDSMLVMSEVDETGNVDSMFIKKLRDYALSDEVKEMVSGIAGITNESYSRDAYEILESVGMASEAENFRANLVRELKTSRSMEEAYSAIKKFMSKVSDVDLEIAAAVEELLIDELSGFFSSKDFVKQLEVLAKAKPEESLTDF